MSTLSWGEGIGILGRSFNIFSEDFESFCISGFCRSIFLLLLALVGRLTWPADETRTVDRAELFPSPLRSVLKVACSVGFPILPGFACDALWEERLPLLTETTSAVAYNQVQGLLDTENIIGFANTVNQYMIK
jgi:hypothetical protein